MATTLKDDVIKNFGDDIILSGNAIVDKKVLTIPVSPALDIALGGGIPEGSFVILTGHPKTGKCSRLTDLIYTPSGPQTMGDMKVGSIVSTPDGKTANVIGIYPQGKKDIYEVKFNDGTKTYCGLEHNWTVARNKSSNHYITMTLEEIMNEGLRYDDRWKWKIPTTKPVYFKQNKRFNLKPYILGTILDSGSIENNELILTTNNKSVLNIFKNFYQNRYKKLNLKRIDKYDYLVRPQSQSSVMTFNSLLQTLRALKLSNRSKVLQFIPNTYKYSSVQNRFQLIRGIFDSGALNDNGRIVRYSSTNKIFVDDIREVVESLGFICKLYVEVIEENGKSLSKYHLTVQGNDVNQLFNIASKKKNTSTKPDIFRTIVSVKKFSKEEAVCIELDSKEGLYLTNNFIVTHNTTTSLAFAATAQLKDYQGDLKTPREVYYLNIEGRLKKRDLEGIPGLDLDRFHVIGSQQGKILHGEEYLQIAERIINEIPGSIVIIDSYSALCTEAEITSEMDKMQRADGAKLLAKFCRKVANVIPVNKNIVIGITHLMGNPTGYGAEFKEKSGQAIAYQTDVKIRAKSFKPWVLGADNTQIGQEVEWQVVCSALGPPGAVATSYIRYGQGIDKCTELINLASDIGIINKGGAWYTITCLEDKPKFQGTEKVRLFLMENPKAFKVVEEKVKEFLGSTK